MRIQKPIRMTFEEHPVTIVTKYHVDKIPHSNTVLISESVTTKGFSEITYEYDHYQIEILRPLLETETKIKEMSESADIEQIIFTKNNLHGKTGEDSVSIGNGGQEYIIRILEQLNFVFGRYISEKGWPSSFLQKLFYVSFQYGSQSTYVIVREKPKDGKKGSIIGSIRLISTPYANFNKIDQLGADQNTVQHLAEMILGTEKNWLPGFSFNAYGDQQSNFTKKIVDWNPNIWKYIFGTPYVKVQTESIASISAQVSQSVSMVPAPFEAVLERRYIKERQSDLETNTIRHDQIGHFVEPGNFAVIPDKDLSPEVKGIASVALYFHIARLIREDAGTRGPATRIGTYASEGSSSDRFYKSLGFALHEQIPPGVKDRGNPTDETWNVLMGKNNTLSTAFLKRFRLRINEHELHDIFESFDKYEKQKIDNSFFKRVSQSLFGIIK